MGASDERHMLLLRRKLQALNYNDHLDETSSDLVQNLVNDLVHTTESYRSLKERSEQQQHQLATFQSKARRHCPLQPRTSAIGSVVFMALSQRRADGRRQGGRCKGRQRE
jgi:predicted patatin/cPLA2 family phospholipase